MGEWLKYILGFLGTLIIVLGTILVTWMKLEHDKKEREKDRKHQKEIIYLNNKDAKEIINYLKETSYIEKKDMLECKHNKRYKKWKKLRITSRGDKNEW